LSKLVVKIKRFAPDTVESREESVAGRFDFAAAKAGETASYRSLMIAERIASALVAECGRLFARADKIGEENRGLLDAPTSRQNSVFDWALRIR